MKSSPLNTLLFTGLLLTTAVSSGCRAPNLKDYTSWVPFGSFFGIDKDVRWADKDNPAVRCVCLWQPAEGTWQGRPCRGFGGQVFFLDRETARPIAIRGDIRIHVFDDHGPRKDRAKPVHTFDFTKGAWNAFLVKTQFGPAYNIFIPYTREGYEKSECALRIRMVDEGVPAIFSDMSYVRLEGSRKKGDASVEELAGSRSKENRTEERRTTGFDGGDSIGQIMQKVPVSKNTRGLPPDLEARLATLRHKMPIASRDDSNHSEIGQVADGAEFAPPSFDQSSGNRERSSVNPRNFDPPAFASPISAEHRRPGTDREDENNRKARRAAGDNSTLGKRHVLSPAHPLVGRSSNAAAIQQVHAAQARAGSNNWIAERTTSNQFDRMIGEAEAAAARNDWARAIKLASRVDRAVRDENASWPVERPTPSALVAQWEIQRIESVADGDRSQWDARIDSRVDDYLKASKAQLDQDKTSEARRLATVAHLISRGSVQSDGQDNVPPTSPVTSSRVALPAATVPPAAAVPAANRVTRRLHPLDSNWVAPAQPPAQPAHPLESSGGFE